MLGIRERLAVDLKDALQAKDEIRLSTIRMARSEILLKIKNTEKKPVKSKFSESSKV